MRWSGRAGSAALVLVVVAVALVGAHAQEPARFDGRWTGTWWMGKYEEPIEMELLQQGAVVSGRVVMLGYPRADPDEQSGRGMPIRDGRIDGDRLVLVWHMGARSFTLTLTRATAGSLVGLVGLGGEDGRADAGFLLGRAR
jgi:hypothetical protein